MGMLWQVGSHNLDSFTPNSRISHSSTNEDKFENGSNYEL